MAPLTRSQKRGVPPRANVAVINKIIRKKGKRKSGRRGRRPRRAASSILQIGPNQKRRKRIPTWAAHKGPRSLLVHFNK